MALAPDNSALANLLRDLQLERVSFDTLLVIHTKDIQIFELMQTVADLKKRVLEQNSHIEGINVQYASLLNERNQIAQRCRLIVEEMETQNLEDLQLDPKQKLFKKCKDEVVNIKKSLYNILSELQRIRDLTTNLSKAIETLEAKLEAIGVENSV